MNLEGKYLYSSCAGETFGRIDKQHIDINKCNVIDITIYNIKEILHFQAGDDSGFESYLTDIDLPNGSEFQILNVGYKVKDITEPGDEERFVVIELNMPEGGCYRCSQSFVLRDKKQP